MHKLIIKFVYSLIRNNFHEKRCDLFFDLMNPQNGMTILDLGGANGELLQRIKRKLNGRFIIADIYHQKHEFEFVLLKANKPLPFDDQSIDIVFCNSVIEHLANSFEEQNKFANEIRRIGKAYFVQTPNKNFPIEAHTWLPWVNLLKHRQLVFLIPILNKFWFKKCENTGWRLLTIKEMQQLFPKGKICIERFLGLSKSIIAYKTL